MERSSYRLIMNSITNASMMVIHVVGYMPTSKSANAVTFIIPTVMDQILCVSVNMHEQSMFIKV